MYKQCIEFYDGKQDPIKYYFIDKFQNILSVEKELNSKIFKKSDLKSQNSNEIDNEVFHDVMNEQDNLLVTSTSILRRAKSDAY